MRLPEVSLENPRRWWISILFMLALGSLVLLGYSVFQAFNYPYDGILNLYSSGLIKEIDEFSPAGGKLSEEDVILSVDGVPIADAFPFYSNKRGGDTVNLVVKRGEEIIQVSLELIQPPAYEILSRLMSLMAALVFLLVGVGVLTFSPKERSAERFFLFCVGSSILLASGASSYQSPPWISAIFNFCLWLIGPLALHFHLHFPQTTALNQRLRGFLAVFYVIALAGGLPYLIWGRSAVVEHELYPWLMVGGRLFLVLNLLLLVALLFYNYRNIETAGVRAKIRIVVLGGVLSVLPVVTLSILPDVLIQQPIIPYPYAFLLVGILPLTYGFAIIRHRLIEIEKHVNRGATFILVYSTLGGFYLLLYALIHQFTPASLSEDPVVNTLLVLFLATVFVPLKQRVQRLVDTVFYGSWYDYRSAVTLITQGLEQITELPSLAETISERLVRTLRLQPACVFLRDLDGRFSVIAVSPRVKYGEQPPPSFPVLSKTSLSYFLKLGVVERSAIRKVTADITLTQEERKLLYSEEVYLWVPIIGHGQVLGLMALGPKYGGDVFSSEDVDILQVIARQISPLIENIHLVTRLKRYAAELEQRVAQRTEELHAAKERVEAILASVGEGVFVTNLDWEVVTVNSAFEEQTGYPASEIIDQKIWNFVHFEPAGLLDKIETDLQQGIIWNGELNNHCKNGTQYDVLVTVAPMCDQSGQVVGYVGSQRDITRQKELDRLKDRLIFDVSHELRTPVTNLNLYLELMEHGRAEKKSDYLSVIKGETNRLIGLIESILDLSRLDMWKSKKVELSAVDINLVAEQVITAHFALAESAGLDLVFQPGQNIPLILGEQNQLARLVTNLLSNAIRYTQKGSVCLQTFQKNGQICLQVQDTGIGIEPDDLPNIFDRFYRGRQVSQSQITGTGLGLAIVKEIVEIHEGTIEVESEVCRGSTFRVLLPMHPSEKTQHLPRE